ncbi:phosphatase PAP2 family protein [Agreia bicolorata]|uniref:phosphatase PAP2 family protein n=1 Tax=Agreia bicolorata TaxID=110935 RepID=UPI0013793A35|nr:phosphatase PAP2 family protein [Agreia bicolorata]
MPSVKHAAPAPGAHSYILRAAPHPRRTLIVAIVAVVMLTLIGFLLRSHPVDLQLSQAFNAAHVGALGAFTSAVYVAIGPVPAIIGTALVAVAIGFVGRNWRRAAAFAGVVGLTWVPSDLVKILVDRPRPDAQLLAHPYSPAQVDASYPSGHTVFIVALVIAALYLLVGTRWFRVGVVVGGVLVAVVVLSVVIDGLHYTSDALASVVWALAVAPAARLVWVDWILARFWPGRR